MEVRDLLILAKNGDSDAKEALIKKYYGFIVQETKGIFLNSYTFEDLIQTGIESILKGINSFDMENGTASFNSYVFWCLKNNFNYLCRKEIRNNSYTSLNVVIKDNMESIDFIQADETLEETVLKRLLSKELIIALKSLDEEELEIINFLYLNTSTGKKQFLSKYAEIKGKDYYYCTTLKKRAFQKLKASILLSK